MAAGLLRPPVVLLFTMLIVPWKFHGHHVRAHIISGEEVLSTDFQKTIVHDVSEVIRSDKNLNGTEILPKDLYNLEADISTRYYFLARDRGDDDYCWEIQKCGWFGLEGISIMFGDEANKRDVLTMKNVSLTKATFVDLLKRTNSSIHSVTFLVSDRFGCSAFTRLKEYLTEKLKIDSLKSAIKKIGIEYNDNLLQLCIKEVIPLLESMDVDHTILRIRVSPLKTMFLYQIFANKMRGLIQRNRRFVRKFHHQCTLYIRLQNEGFDKIVSPDSYDRYKALMTTYLRTFSRQHSGGEVYICNPTSKQVNIMPNNVYFRQNVLLFYGKGSIQGFKNASLDCMHQEMVKILLTHVQQILQAKCQVEGKPIQTSWASSRSLFYEEPEFNNLSPEWLFR